MGAQLTGTGTLTATATVERAVNSIRLAILAIVLTLGAGVGATAGFSEHSVPCGLLWGFGAMVVGVAVLAVLFRWPWLKQKVLTLMDWIVGP